MFSTPNEFILTPNCITSLITFNFKGSLVPFLSVAVIDTSYDHAVDGIVVLIEYFPVASAAPENIFHPIVIFTVDPASALPVNVKELSRVLYPFGIVVVGVAGAGGTSTFSIDIFKVGLSVHFAFFATIVVGYIPIAAGTGIVAAYFPSVHTVVVYDCPATVIVIVFHGSAVHDTTTLVHVVVYLVCVDVGIVGTASFSILIVLTALSFHVVVFFATSVVGYTPAVAGTGRVAVYFPSIHTVVVTGVCH